MTSLFDLVYLQNLCKKYQVYPSKKYGQNFLINPAPIEKMLEAAMLHPDDTIIEIGPGFGVLTLALAQQVKKIYAFEIEKRLERYWNECHQRE
jgi:16S rRNA (adenine1518-N6/adenine1519-N6)-dimethyltransferase